MKKMLSTQKLKIVVSWIILVLIAGAFSAQAEKSSGLIAADATLTEVQSGFQFTEGPAADRAGNIYFTDVHVVNTELFYF